MIGRLCIQSSSSSKIVFEHRYRKCVGTRCRLQHCAEKDHPHCYEEAKISGQPDLFMLSALQILFLTSRKHLIATLPIFTRPLALPLALDRVSPSKFDSNPLIWMLTVNGMMVDFRHLPIEGPGSCLSKRTDSVCPWRQALLTTDIQAFKLWCWVLGRSPPVAK
jgi:hypothetical protein